MRTSPKLAERSMWRWLLLTLLLTSVVSQNFAPPKSVYRIEEVISNTRYAVTNRKTALFSHAAKHSASKTEHSSAYQLQSNRLRFLAKTLQLHAELSISNKLDLQHLITLAAGYYLQSRSQSTEEPFLFS